MYSSQFQAMCPMKSSSKIQNIFMINDPKLLAFAVFHFVLGNLLYKLEVLLVDYSIEHKQRN